VNSRTRVAAVVALMGLGIAPRAPAQGWEPAVDLSPPEHDAALARLAFSSSGPTRTAVWQRHDGSHWILQAAEWVSGSWRPATDLSQAGGDAVAGQIAYMELSPTRTAVWQRHNGSHWRVQAALWLQGSWQPPQTLSPAGADAIEPQLAAGTFGPIVAWRQFDGTWRRSDGDHARIESAARIALAAWSPAVAISAAGGDAAQPRLDFAESSVFAAAVWQRHDGVHWRIQSAGRVGESCAGASPPR
jgi:hypothetical protein